MYRNRAVFEANDHPCGVLDRGFGCKTHLNNGNALKVRLAQLNVRLKADKQHMSGGVNKVMCQLGRTKGLPANVWNKINTHEQ
jgi:hypothetical protein